MRKIYLVLLTVLFAAISNAQNIANYAFTPVAGSFTALVGGTNVPSVQADDATSPSIPIGFTFYYMGVPYTSLSANSNGWLSFNASPTANTIDMRTNDFATAVAGLHPLLAPVWDDLDGRTSVVPNPVASYLTTGVAGSRIFTFEWLNWGPFGALVPNISFQVKLYEATSMVEYIYRQDGAATFSSASCGISNGSTSFASLSNLGAAPTVSNVTSTNTITALPATGQTYRFTPPTGVIAAPTALTFSPVGRTSITLNWTDNSTNETFFTVSRATAVGGPYTLIGNVASTTTAGTGTGYTFNSTGLLPGTTYFYRVTASLEGAASPNLSGSQATDPLTSFSGAYTINPNAPNSGTNFTTWTEAVSSLNIAGVSGPTTITVTGTAATITFAEGNLLLGGPYISGIPQSALLTTLNATNTLTFVAGPGKTINMSGVGTSTTIDYVFRLMGVDYVTFDGINIIDPATNITNTTQFEFGYVIGNAAVNDGATNNTIKNFSATLFKTNTGQANGPYGVLVQNGTTIVAALGVTGTNASRNNNNKIQNFTISGAKRGVTFSGLAIPAFDEGNEVSGPAFTSAAGGTWVGGSRITNGGGSTSGTDWGIGIDGQKDMKVFNVQVDNFIETNASPALSGIHFGSAASTANGADNAQIYNCVVHNLENNLSTASGVIGIRASGATLHTLKIYNNAIYDLRATIATGANVVVGMLLTPTLAGCKIELYNNSINLPGALAAAGISKGFGLAGIAGTLVTAKNNVINFGTTGGGSTGGVIAIDFGALASTLIDFSNNLYNVGTPSAARRVAVYGAGSINRITLIDWQSTQATPSEGVDQRTGYGDPGFVSGTDLTYGASNSVENSGVPVSGLATAGDILGVARSASTPDIGVFEGNFSAGFVDVASPGIVIAPLEGPMSSEVRVVITDNVNTVSNLTARLWYRLGVAGAFTGLPPDIAPGGNNNGTYRWGTSLRALAPGTYQYYIVVKDAANNYFADPTMTPGAVSPGFASAPDPNWAGANPFPSVGVRTFQNAGSILAGGTYNVGTGETYTTLTAVANELSTKPISGNVIFELTNNYTGAGETFPIVFNQPSYTVAGPLTITIRPAAGVVTERVTSGDPGSLNPLLLLDGMRDMILDGRPGGVGTSRMWRITNTRDIATATIGEAIRMQNDALRNKFQYLTLQANTSAAGLGGVFGIGSTFFGGKGNNLNLVDNCDIGPNAAGVLATNPLRGISNAGGTNALNTGNTYSNNNIHDYHNTAFNPIGIALSGETGITITGNSFYQTAARSGWAAFGLGISVGAATGPGAIINNNYFGGTAPLCGGTPMTISATTTVFYGIQINTGQYTSASTINGNTYTNMNLTTANTAAGAVVALAINPTGTNNQFPLTISNNTIGSVTVDATTSPAIVLTSTSTGAPSSFSGIFGGVTGVVTITNNTIGGVRCASTGTGTTGFIGIQIQTTGVAANIDNNQIGSLATANNIVQSTNAAISAIVHTGVTNSNASISNNTVANVLFNAAAGGTSQTFVGIAGSGGSAPLTINGNTIRDVVGNNHTTVTGISMSSTANGTSISGNTIRNFTINPQVPATSITVQGIQINAGASSGVVSKNIIHSLINGSTNTGALLRGIQNNFGTGWTYSNNMVTLGAGVTGDIIIRGFDDFSDAPATGFGNYYYNTVSIGGSVAAGAINTYAFYRSTSSTPMTFRNNIFSNTRTGGTGFHVAMANPTSATGWLATASDYNDLYSTNPATVAQWLGTAAANNRTLATWQAAQVAGSGGDANSKSALPVFVGATDLHLSTAAGANWCLNGSGIVIPSVTTDIDGQVRSVGVAPLGPDMGADEFVAVGTPDIATPAAQSVCSGNPITTIVLSGGAASYSWTRDNNVSATGIAASGVGNISGTLTNITASPVTVTFTITALNANGCTSPSATFTATVVVTPVPSATISYAGSPYCQNAGTATVTQTGTAGGTYSSTAGLTLNAANGDVTLGTSTPGTYTVTYTVAAAGGCPVYTTTTSITITATPFATISYAGSPYCTNGGTATVTRTGTAGGTYSSTAGLTLNAANGDVTLGTSTPGTYTVTYTIAAAGGCPVFTTTASITVNAIPVLSGALIQPTTCASNDGQIDLTVSGPAGPYTYVWSTSGGSGIIPGVQDQTTLSVGQYTVVVTAANGCQQTAVFNMPGPGGCSICPTIGSVTTSPTPAVCGNATVTLTASGLTFMGVTYGITFKYSLVALADPYTGGTVIGTVANGSLGGGGTTATLNTTFVVSGNYIIYAILSPTPTDPLCRPSASVSLTVSTPPSATISYAGSPYCANAGTATVTRTGTAGGTYSSTAGLTLNAANGDVTLGTSTPGTYTVTYTIAASGGCPVYTTTTTITITATPSATINYAGSPYCSNAGTATVTRTGTAGGTYSSTAGLTLNAANGDVTLGTSTPGTYTVTYTIAAAGGCAAFTTTATITINPTPSVSPVPPNQTVCNNALTAPVTFTGPVAGTTYSWVNNTPSIGLAASGTGNIASFSAINIGTTPVTATITVTPATIPTGSATFNYTGAVQTFVVPAGVTSVNIQAFGAQGNTNAVGGVSVGGLGGSATGTLAVTPGQTLFINVGGGATASITGGFNGGGNAGANAGCATAQGGGGGGASDVRITSNTLANRVIVGAGGGGAGGNRVTACGRGAGGGGGGGYYGGGGGAGWPGVPGSQGPNPTGGTQVAGGAGGITTFTPGPTNGLPGSLGTGGDGGIEIGSAQGANATAEPGGIGGGLTGGSGLYNQVNNWCGQSGAGGSSYIGGVTSGATSSGVRSGSGMVTISYASGGPTCTGPSVSFTITVNPTPNAVATPSTQTICSGTAMTPIVLSGNVSGTTFNWTRDNQVNVTGIANSGSGNISGTPINNTPGQQTVTFTIIPIANGCPGAPITATLIVNKAPTITCPANITVNAAAGLCGATVTYPPATATGSPAPVITYSQASGTFFPVGTTTVTATATNTCGVATCTFTITVIDAQNPTITCPGNITAPTDLGLCTATIAVPNPVTADNCSVTQLTWVMTGATTGSSPATGINFVGTRAFNLNGTTGQGVTTITYTVRDASGNTATCSFTVTVNDAWIPVIGVGGQPANQTVCVGSNALFSVTASVPAGNPLTYQWQVWTPPVGPWVNITGATSATLPLSAVTFAMNTNSYRVILTGRCSVVTSGVASLYVNQLPTVSILASGPVALLQAQSVTLTAVVTPGGGAYQWFKNGVAVAGATGASVTLTVDDIGSYTVRYTDLNGCVQTSAAMVVSGQASSDLWIYPNPSNGHFHIRVYNHPSEAITVRIFDTKGALLYTRVATTSATPYSDIDINISGDRFIAAENYVVNIIGSDGRLIGSKLIQILQ